MQQNRSEQSIAALSGLLGDVASLLQKAISALLKLVCPSCYEADKYRPRSTRCVAPGLNGAPSIYRKAGPPGKAEAAWPFAPN